MNLDSEQIVAGAQQCNLETEMESAERKPGLRFSITIFKVACVSPNNFTARKENTKNRHCPNHESESIGPPLAGGLTLLLIVLNFYKITHFSFGWLQFRIGTVRKRR